MTNAYAASAVSLIEPGVTVWSRERGTEGVGEDGKQLAPIGGTVIGSEEARDPETGDLARVFVVASTGQRITFHRFTEAEVDPALLEPMSTNALEKVVLAMADAVSRNAKGARKRRLDIPADVELVKEMGRLVGLIMGGAQ